MNLTPAPLTAAAFAPYGDVIEAAGAPDRIINDGLCDRFHDRGRLDFGPGGRAGISLFSARARHLPLRLTLVERHPLGSQCFVPLDGVPMLLVVAAPDPAAAAPGRLAAFLSGTAQAVNLLRGTWHAVLAPIGAPGRYIVIDRIGDGANLDEHRFADPPTIDPP